MSSWPGGWVGSLKFKRTFCLLLHMLELPYVTKLKLGKLTCPHIKNIVSIIFQATCRHDTHGSTPDSKRTAFERQPFSPTHRLLSLLRTQKVTHGRRSFIFPCQKKKLINSKKAFAFPGSSVL